MNKKKVLIKKPEPSKVFWYGESNLGSSFDETEIKAVTDVLKNSNHWSKGLISKSNEVQIFEKNLAKFCNVKYAIALTNGGAGLELALRSLNLTQGDEVICPAVNFKAAHMAILDRGAKVIFCDINPITLNIDCKDLENKISSRTRAIIPVHLTGLPAPIDEINQIAKKYKNLKHGSPKIIYDGCRALGAEYKGRPIGKDGWCTIFSFHSQKIITTMGEGGALVTNDKKLSDKVRSMSSYGGEFDWGMNYRMSKIQSVFGNIQLKRISKLIKKRRKIAINRNKRLKEISSITLPFESADCKHAFYVYPILVNENMKGKIRDKILNHLKDKFGIVCSITNKPVYSRWKYIKKKCGNPKLPVSDNIEKRLLCPPIHPNFNNEQEEYIINAITETVKNFE